MEGDVGGRGGGLKLSNGGGGKPQRHKGMGACLWGKLTPFDLAIGGLGWMNWLINGAGNCLYFMPLFLHYILLVKILLVKVKYLYIEYA